MPDMMKIGPLAGIDNASKRDDALQIGGDQPSFYLRDANNVLLDNGRARMRPGLRLVSSAEYQDVWQSSLHGDVFGRLGDTWVKIMPGDPWIHEFLVEIGEGPASHAVLNNVVLVSGRNGLFQYDGAAASRFTIDKPPAPMVTLGPGSMGPGRYGFAVAWLRGGKESPLSDVTHIDAAAAFGASVTVALALDATVTGVRLYMTSQNGGELRRAGDHPLGAVSVSGAPKLGAAAQFRFMAPMPAGRFLSVWRGRLVTASVNVLRFSQALAYHVHDPRHDFVQMPQRITFVEPVAGGLWVGQVDHVAFLAGDSPSGLSLRRLAVSGPLQGTAARIHLEGQSDMSGGNACAVWLAKNGYVVGLPDGNVMEVNANRIDGLMGVGASAVLDNRVLTVTT